MLRVHKHERYDRGQELHVQVGETEGVCQKHDLVVHLSGVVQAFQVKPFPPLLLTCTNLYIIIIIFKGNIHISIF